MTLEHGFSPQTPGQQAASTALPASRPRLQPWYQPPHKASGRGHYLRSPFQRASRSTGFSRHFLRAALLLLLSLLTLSSTARADQSTTFDAACASFRRAVELAPKDPKASSAAALESAAGFRELADSNIRNHKLQVNLGNAYLVGGDLGRAVLAYRRAQEIKPDDPRVRAGLAAVRARVGVSIDPDTEHRLLSELLSWRAYASRTTMLAIFLAAYVGGWSLALLRVTLRAPRWGGLGALLGVISMAALALLILDDFAISHSRDAVITAPTTIGYSGPGQAIYEPSFKDPLRAGVECRILDSRAPWTQVKLADGRETWLPSSSLEMVSSR